MDFIEFQAIVESLENPIDSSDEVEELTNDEIKDFIDYSEQPEEDISFYRDPANLGDYYKFPNQTRDPRHATYEDDEMYFGKGDSQHELFAPQTRDEIEFDSFSGIEKFVKKFKETL